jgi:Flp pilus assembly protein TadD
MQPMSLEKAIELAQQLKARGKPAEAEHVYRQLSAQLPNNTFVLNQLGICVAESMRIAEAREIFKRAVEIDPKFTPAWGNLSLAYERMDDFDAAIAARRKAIEQHETGAEHWHRLGTCYGKKGDMTEAIAALKKSVELDPGIGGAHHDLVLALCRDGQLELAEEVAFRRIAMGKTVDAEMLRPLADGFKTTGRFEHATDIWRRAIAADPGCHEARGQLAMCLITEGKYEEGWRLYECRWDCDTFAGNTRLDPQREWGREPIGRPDVSGRTIVIYSEQGVGDSIHFARYATFFAERGARVILQCHWPIKTLMERCNGVRLVYASTEALPNYDWHIPMLSLPYAFATTIQNIPAKIPYIRVDPARRKNWAAKVESATPPGTRLRIGIAWAGNPKHKNDANRSLDPSLLEPLADVEGIAYFSLQKANENEKAAIPPNRPKLIDFTPSLYDFAETAALMDNLDLVICADTAVCHLAGAIGKPVCTLLPMAPDFRWGLHNAETPWYPTMRLFRQSKAKDWKLVIENVVDALKSRIAEANPTPTPDREAGSSPAP